MRFGEADDGRLGDIEMIIILWEALIIAGCGALGGLVNGLMTDRGIVIPTRKDLPDGGKVLLPGIVGNIVIGLAAALFSWGLYGPAAAVPVFGGDGKTPDVVLTLAAMAGAGLVGVSGANWLSTRTERDVTAAISKALAQATGRPPDGKPPDGKAATPDEKAGYVSKLGRALAGKLSASARLTMLR